MNKIYTDGKNPFALGKVVNFKQTVIYPNVGDVRYQVQLDKNGQVYDIYRSYATVVNDKESKKRFVKVSLGGRPRSLYDRIKGRPISLALPWIDMHISSHGSIKE